MGTNDFYKIWKSKLIDFFRNEFSHSLGPRFTKDDDMDFMIKENVISDSLVSKINSAIDAGDYEKKIQ